MKRPLNKVPSNSLLTLTFELRLKQFNELVCVVKVKVVTVNKTEVILYLTSVLCFILIDEVHQEKP